MIDYDFYVNTYLGTVIPEKAFDSVAARAADALRRFRYQYQILGSHEVSEKMALCAMAETLYTHKREGVSAATVGSVSVRYDNTGSLTKRLLRQAGIYLDIYRGTSLCVH